MIIHKIKATISHAIAALLGAAALFLYQFLLVPQYPTLVVRHTELSAAHSVFEAKSLTEQVDKSETKERSRRKILVSEPTFNAQGQMLSAKMATILEARTAYIKSDINKITDSVTVSEQTSNNSKIIETTVRHISRFSLGISTTLYSVRDFKLKYIKPRVDTLKIEGGVRLFGSPTWLIAGYNFNTNQGSLGFRVEF